ncbi:hypothetical protein [Nereida sp. MMG025]|uniref:hypothetical protein n=1 Tax=Nereida sp. MMG025 TaxID=2909981 RepID=UPI001F31E411|nr:hypothetical protein [Nereida sp. MMG025]MCF6445840.1 hypothetical protein [Nereida sp. MMG025]
MKRTVFTSAIALIATATIAGANSVYSEINETELQRYIPGLEVEILDETTVLSAMNIATGGETFSQKEGKLKALLMDANVMVMGTDNQPVMIIDAPDHEAAADVYKSAIERFIPEADFAALTDEEIASMANVVFSGGTFSQKKGKLDGLYMDYTS